MSKPLDSSTRQQLAARVNYYREMGIYDFYRRPVDASLELQPATELEAVTAPEPMPAKQQTVSQPSEPLPTIQDKPAALKA
ncbi:MAG TPA: hypothetical protein VFW31_18115, partial [Candidatus Angelobacter sp.]|nr:hypothetical protein [Candidatus Angelobacter sp.]